MIVELRRYANYTKRNYELVLDSLKNKHFPKYNLIILRADLIGEQIKQRYMSLILDIPDEILEDFKEDFNEIYYEIRRVNKKQSEMYIREYKEGLNAI